jgi:hypothetical protein
MTINHFFMYVAAHRMPIMRAFYADALKPLGYSELIPVPGGQLYGFGSDYPYLWLQALPEGQTANPIHVAIDAPSMFFRPQCL